MIYKRKQSKNGGTPQETVWNHSIYRDLDDPRLTILDAALKGTLAATEAETFLQSWGSWDGLGVPQMDGL